MKLVVCVLLAVFTSIKAQLSGVQNVKVAPVQYQEYDSVTVSWDQPSTLGGSQVSDLFYNVRSCLISSSNCKDYGNITKTTQTMTGFERELNQIYTYHIITFGKNNEKGPEVKDIITLKARDTCKPDLFTCEKSNQCIDKIKLCDGLQGCSDNSDETAFAKCTLPGTPKPITFGKITETSVEISYTQLEPKHRTKSYKIEITDIIVNGIITKTLGHQKFSVASKTTTVQGLTPGTEYKIRISAINPVGQGPWSSYVNLKTEGIAPLSGVRSVKITPVQYKEYNSVTVSWVQPAVLGGSQVSDLFYSVRSCLISSANCKDYGNITKTTQTMTGFERELKQIYTYHIIVFGKNNKKGPEVKDLITFKDRDTCEPSLFACEKSNQCIDKIKLCDGLQGCNDNSDETAFAKCTLPGAPEAVKFDKITETSTEILYTQLAQKHRVNNYKIEIIDTVDNSKLTKTVSHQNYFVGTKTTPVQGLKPGTEYKIRISGINPVGQGPWSDYVNLKTEGKRPSPVIGKVTNVKVEPKKYEESSAVVITWDPPAKNADNIDKYMVFYCEINKADTCKTLTPKSNSVEITGLDKRPFYTIHINTISKEQKNGTEFNRSFQPAKKRTCPASDFTCEATDNCISTDKLCNGISDCTDNSDETGFANCSVPLVAPTKISIVKESGTGFTVKFTQIHNRHRPTNYEISVQNAKTNSKLTKKKNHEKFGFPDVSVKIEGLDMKTEYIVRVRANNPVGPGPWSKLVAAKTKTFGPVLNVRLVPVEYKESSSFVITWDPPHGMDTSKFTYKVKYCRINMKETCKTTDKITGTSAKIIELLRADIYQWEIMVFDGSDIAGTSIQDTYKTQPRNKCTSDDFKCTESPQCIPKKNTCNLIFDCNDKSDEKTDGGCNAPRNLPTRIQHTQNADGSLGFTFTKLPNIDRITGYNVQIRDVIKDEIVYTEYKKHSYLAGPKVKVLVSGLTQGRQYEARFQGTNPTGDGPWSIPLGFSAGNINTTKKPSVNDPDSSESSSGMTGAQKAGIAIGVILGLVVIVIAIIVILRQHGKKKGNSQVNKYTNGKTNSGYEMDKRP